jgi:hypothetical protein
MRLRRVIPPLPPRRRWAPKQALFYYGIAFAAIHAGALLLLRSGSSFWQALGIACGTAFLAGLLAGALRLITPMDTEALGEVVRIPSTLPREAPVLLVATVIGMAFTPVAGLICYLILGYARSCIDERVLLVFGLTIVSSLILSLPFSRSSFVAVMFYSRLMLPSAMVGWALSSFFRSDVW